MRVLVLGASGMLGYAVFRVLSETVETWGTARNPAICNHFTDTTRLLLGVDALCNLDAVVKKVKPDLIVNCVGVIKQLTDDPLVLIPVNSLLPHRLATMADRVIQVSTDCVFSGSHGDYWEGDAPDADDFYGMSKCLGELRDDPHLTIRTSIIGRELETSHSLVEWFLKQKKVRGFRQAIFSGLPTLELARIIRDIILPRPDLTGLYHVSADPISKHDLLVLLADALGHEVDIEPDDELVIDRSLNSDRFREATGYQPPPWSELVRLV